MCSWDQSLQVFNSTINPVPLHEQRTSNPHSSCLHLLDEVLCRKVVALCILAKCGVMLAFIVLALMFRLPALVFSGGNDLFGRFILKKLLYGN